MRAYHERVDATTRVGMDRAHTLFVDTYHDLGTKMVPFDKSGGGGDPLLRLVARGLGVPPVYHDETHVLHLPRYLRRDSACLVP
jgi:hypothetical protein